MDDLKSITIEMHYFLYDCGLHSMNAKVHNECAKQLIQTLMHLNKYLNEPIEIEVLAKNEGGIKDFYKIMIKNPLLLIVITTLINSTINQFFTSNFSPAINITEETRNKLDNLLKIKELINSGTFTSEEFDYVTQNDKDLKKLKSNFFRSAKREHRIESIEVCAISQDNSPVISNIRINSSEFDNCVLPEELVTIETEVAAKIYIVSPVLLKGRKDYWKGIYNGSPIEFKVSDKVFLENVYQHIIKFSNGTYIICSMKIVKTTSTIDDSEKTNRNVFDIESYGDDEMFHKIYKRKSKAINRNADSIQSSLFIEME